MRKIALTFIPMWAEALITRSYPIWVQRACSMHSKHFVYTEAADNLRFSTGHDGVFVLFSPCGESFVFGPGRTFPCQGRKRRMGTSFRIALGFTTKRWDWEILRLYRCNIWHTSHEVATYEHTYTHIQSSITIYIYIYIHISTYTHTFYTYIQVLGTPFFSLLIFSLE